jgi:hypothetical protein
VFEVENDVHLAALQFDWCDDIILVAAHDVLAVFHHLGFFRDHFSRRRPGWFLHMGRAPDRRYPPLERFIKGIGSRKNRRAQYRPSHRGEDKDNRDGDNLF